MQQLIIEEQKEISNVLKIMQHINHSDTDANDNKSCINNTPPDSPITKKKLNDTSDKDSLNSITTNSSTTSFIIYSPRDLIIKSQHESSRFFDIDNINSIVNTDSDMKSNNSLNTNDNANMKLNSNFNTNSDTNSNTNSQTTSKMSSDSVIKQILAQA